MRYSLTVVYCVHVFLNSLIFDQAAVVSFTVIRSEPSDSSDGSDLSSMSPFFYIIFLYCFTIFTTSFLLSAPLLLKIFPLKTYKNIVICLIVIYVFVFILHLHFITLHHLMHILFPCHLYLLSLFLMCI